MRHGITVKTLEIRDDGTRIDVIAFFLVGRNELERYYWNRCNGYPTDGSGIIVMRLSDQRASVDPYEWGDRTMANGHNFIYENFDTLADGDVVDVEFILGETAAPKISERLQGGLDG